MWDFCLVCFSAEQRRGDGSEAEGGWQHCCYGRAAATDLRAWDSGKTPKASPLHLLLLSPLSASSNTLRFIHLSNDRKWAMDSCRCYLLNSEWTWLFHMTDFCICGLVWASLLWREKVEDGGEDVTNFRVSLHENRITTHVLFAHVAMDTAVWSTFWLKHTHAVLMKQIRESELLLSCCSFSHLCFCSRRLQTILFHATYCTIIL